MGEDGARPTSGDDREAWKAYWATLGMAWRTEPEIPETRQDYLSERKKVHPDVLNGIYPFRNGNDRIRLDRSDIEWLLATLDDGREHGPVEWGDVAQRKRVGLDLRGADLTGVDFHDLPLARSLMAISQDDLSADKIDAASVKFRCDETDEQVAIHMKNVHLEGANLVRANLRGAILTHAHLEGADLRETHLEGADFYHAHLQGTVLSSAHLEHAKLVRADLERTELQNAFLAGANLTLAAMNPGTLLDAISLTSPEHGAVRLADVRWGGANLTVVDWQQIPRLGDDADMQASPEGMQEGLKIAVRANRQMATTLRTQGLSDDADKFAYRGQLRQREMLRHQGGGKVLAYLGSFIPWALSGYGYRIWRIVGTYGFTLVLFAVIYWLLGVHSFQGESGGQALWDSFLVSLSAIHGRTVFEQLGQWSPTAWVAAIESVVGIVIEGMFVAMLIQRWFLR